LKPPSIVFARLFRRLLGSAGKMQSTASFKKAVFQIQPNFLGSVISTPDAGNLALTFGG
jgi:hypothetical protein